MMTGEIRGVDEWKKKIEMVVRRVNRGGMGGGRSTTELAGARGWNVEVAVVESARRGTAKRGRDRDRKKERESERKE